MPTVLVPVADGSEEMELITIVDVLRRAEIDVTIASLSGEAITASRGTRIIPDAALADVLDDNFDLVVLPGGLPGADNLDNDPRIHVLLKRNVAEGRLVGAICAAPRVLAHAGLLDGKRATSYPGFLDDIAPEVSSTGEAVEWDGNVVTSRGPGTAMDFALTLIEVLRDASVRETIESGLVRT
ncbi:MAG: DJ-1 family glyoxalase III [Candidatus Hydrogenedentota bacterium]